MADNFQYPDTITGSELASRLGTAFERVLKMHRASTRPQWISDAGSGFWIDESTSPDEMKYFDGTNDITVFEINSVGQIIRFIGTMTFSDNLNMNSNKILNVSEGTVQGDAIERNQLLASSAGTNKFSGPDLADMSVTSTPDSGVVRDTDESVDISEMKSAPTQPNATADNQSAALGQTISQSRLQPDFHAIDQKTPGTAGGSVTADARNLRELNTVLRNDITGASLASNQVTLPAGDYYIEASAQAYNSDRTKLYLSEVGGGTPITGMTRYTSSTSADQITCQLADYISPAAETTYELRHYFEINVGGNSRGVATNDASAEVYAEIKIWKVG